MFLFQVRLQTQPTPAPGQSVQYAGLMDCARKTIAKEVRSQQALKRFFDRLICFSVISWYFNFANLICDGLYCLLLSFITISLAANDRGISGTKTTYTETIEK